MIIKKKVNKIQTNSELPLCMLEDYNNELNEIDFVLFHLFSENSDYKEYYINNSKDHPDRTTIFDNSAYEYYVRGIELDHECYVNAVSSFRPDYYLLPDTLMNMHKTLEDSLDFFNEYSKKIVCGPRPVGVLQGNSPADLMTCMSLYYINGIRNICIPFHNSFFKEYARTQVLSEWKDHFNTEVLTEDMKYAAGRVQFLQDNIDILEVKTDYIHLLGSHNPYEKYFIQKLGLIDSMDTGYPVKVALEGYKLFEEHSKPEIIIDEFLTNDLSIDQKNLIASNIRIFRDLY